MNTRDKIHSAINEHIDVDDTYAYFLTRDKSSFSVGTVTLDDFEEWTDSDVADLTDSIMEKINTELNENQQVVLDWLKEEKTNSNLTAFDCIYSFIYGNPKDLVTQIWSELNEKEEGQVLEVFSRWVQEQEE